MIENKEIPIPQDFKIWYIAGSRKRPISAAYKEWVRRGQQLCYEVAYTEGYEDASEAAYRHLSQSLGGPSMRWVSAKDRLPDDLVIFRWQYRTGEQAVGYNRKETLVIMLRDPDMYRNLKWLDESPSLVQPDGWISVAQRPDEYKKVLLYFEGLKVTSIGYLINGRFVSEEGDPFCATPTHWQPLPAAPINPE